MGQSTVLVQYSTVLSPLVRCRRQVPKANREKIVYSDNIKLSTSDCYFEYKQLKSVHMTIEPLPLSENKIGDNNDICDNFFSEDFTYEGIMCENFDTNHLSS